MKNIKKILVLSILALIPGLSHGQFLGPPTAYSRVTADTLSDTALTLVQVPPYGGSNSIKMRSLTISQLAAKIGLISDSACGSSCQAIIGDTATSHGLGADSSASFSLLRLPFALNGGVLYRGADSAVASVQGTSAGQVLTWSAFSGTGVSIASDGTNICVLTSAGVVLCTTNGSDWITKATGLGTRYIAYKGSTWIVLGTAGNFWTTTSADLASWTARNVGASVALNSVEWTGTNFVIAGAATGGDAYVATSSTIGGTFTDQSFGANIQIRTLSWNGSVLVAGTDGTSNNVRTSDASAASWTLRTSNLVNTVWNCAWSSSLSLFACTDNGGGIATSPTGTTWTARTSGVATPLYSVTSNETAFVTGGAGGVILSSTNGTAWTARTSGTSADINGVTSFGTDFYGTGASVAIRSTDDGVTWSSAGTGGPSWLTPSTATAAQIHDSLAAAGITRDSIVTHKIRADSAFVTKIATRVRADSGISFRTATTLDSGVVGRSTTGGLTLYGIAGSNYDVSMRNKSGTAVAGVYTGTSIFAIGSVTSTPTSALTVTSTISSPLDERGQIEARWSTNQNYGISMGVDSAGGGYITSALHGTGRIPLTLLGNGVTVRGGSGARTGVLTASSVSQNSDKTARWKGLRYADSLSATVTPVTAIILNGTASANTMNICGGDAAEYACTAGNIYAGASTSTTTGTMVANWTSSLFNISVATTLQSTLGVTGVATFTAAPRFNGGNTTGSGSALLGSNSPASTLTAPYTWMTVTTSDGSTGYIPIWK